MELSRRPRVDDEAEMPSSNHQPRVDAGQVSAGIEKVLRLALPTKPNEPGLQSRPSATATARDFDTAVDLIRQAAQAMKAADDRSEEAEARVQAVAQRAAMELSATEARLQAAEVRVRNAEARAADAEARAQEADTWLRQILATINEELPGRRSL